MSALSLNSDISIIVTTMTLTFYRFFIYILSIGRTNDERILGKNKSQSIPEHQLKLNFNKNK